MQKLNKNATMMFLLKYLTWDDTENDIQNQ